MALLVARRTRFRVEMKPIVRNVKGQISLFFATTVVILITFIAFIVNVGLFVKAKINLQNAVDAAAWSGASVQARQLSNIAYMNWEMRNVYKEWMFKYYVLGNMSIDAVMNGGGSNVNYIMKSIPGAANEFGIDSYNFPSVCVNFASDGAGGENICSVYSVPGLPVFQAQNLIASDQVTTALTNSLASSKLEACTRRSALNFLTANLWAYNVKDSGGLNAMAPEIAPGRMGAFPAAFEIALRIRNLEKFVNEKPVVSGICTNQGTAAGNCSTMINDYIAQNKPGNERAVKAFYSAYRNLGNDADAEMKDTFTLFELSPEAVNQNPAQNLSNTLIPDSEQTKYYLDLKLMTLNYATFFTSFTSAENSSVSTANYGSVQTSARCDATKMALPVPGYPLGYVKNPSVLTYYAVKGQSSWVGLFNPFDLSNGAIKLTAYAAAKPFGGRIGPALFDVFSDSTLVKARASSLKNVSSGYIMGLDLTKILDWTGGASSGAGGESFVSGAPIPTNPTFWINDVSTAVGGFTDDDNLKFAIPNIVYDYPGATIGSGNTYFSDDKIDVLEPIPGGDTRSHAGLYNGQVFETLREKIGAIGTGTRIGKDLINEAIESVRSPTSYDVANYLIPTPDSINRELAVDSFGSTVGINPASANSYEFKLFAPLFSTHSLYPSPQQAIFELDKFIDIQEKAIVKYRTAMNTAAIAIAKLSNPTQGDRVGEDAARGFSDLDDLNGSPEGQGPSCASISGKFIYFFMGSRANNLMKDISNCKDQSGSQLPTLQESMSQYWSDNLQELENIYSSNYTIPEEMKSKVFTAYRPGPLHDANDAGVWSRSISSSESERMWRNFYSTKFIALNTVLRTGSYNAQNSEFPITSEGNSAKSEISELSVGYNFLNPLRADRIHVDPTSITY